MNKLIERTSQDPKMDKLYKKRIRKDQSIITLDGKKVVVDNNMKNLLKAMNKAGIKTLSHCGGHGKNTAFIRLDLGQVNIEVDSLGVLLRFDYKK